MSLINVSPEAIRAIKTDLDAKGATGPVRIDLHSTGCCDASLGLCLGSVQADDFQEEIDGLTFVISAEMHQAVGEVSIGRVNEADKRGYMLTSSIPLNEWQGFAVCDLQIKK